MMAMATIDDTGSVDARKARLIACNFVRTRFAGRADLERAAWRDDVADVIAAERAAADRYLAATRTRDAKTVRQHKGAGNAPAPALCQRALAVCHARWMAAR